MFARLRGILEPYGLRLHVIEDTPAWYSIDMAPEGQRNPTTWFAGARMGKAYVSYYLMPVYVQPELLDAISAELRKRMQGKSCFNFRSVDEPLLDELEQLTERSFESTADRSGWGVEQREERGMDYRKAMSVDRATHEGRRRGTGAGA